MLLLNEVESDAPSDVSEACSYVEIRGVAGTLVPNGTFFFSVDGDPGNFGALSFVQDLSNVTFGTNGTITLVTAGQACSGRSFPAGTTLVQVDTVLGLGQSAETYMLASAPAGSVFFETDDIDADDDGNIDVGLGISVIDAFAYLTQVGVTRAYGPVLASGEADVPDAATRFPGDLVPLSAGAWYYGELAASPDNTTTYAAPLSANFPAGGALTPGAPNAP